MGVSRHCERASLAARIIPTSRRLLTRRSWRGTSVFARICGCADKETDIRGRTYGRSESGVGALLVSWEARLDGRVSSSFSIDIRIRIPKRTRACVQAADHTASLSAALGRNHSAARSARGCGGRWNGLWQTRQARSGTPRARRVAVCQPRRQARWT